MNIRKTMACVVLAAMSGFGNGAGAAPVHGEIFDWRQPSGETIQVRVWGDEYYRIVESLDGYTVVLDPVSGAACYAELSADGARLLSTGIPASESYPGKANVRPHLRADPAVVRAQVRAARARARMEQLTAIKDGGDPPWRGNTRGLCLLVDFSDQPATIPADEIDRFCNQPGYSGNANNGSVRDYFYEVSNGLLTYTNYVSPAYHRASQPKSYYDDPNDDDNLKAKELVYEILQALEDGGFDFSEYGNGDNIVDALNIFYAGTRQSPWSKGLWPHSGTLVPPFQADGMACAAYQITNIGSSLYIGTFCHENGHMICRWPDLYDYTYFSTGVGNFCLMSYGGPDRNPVHPCAYLKDLAGWTTTLVFPVGPEDLSLTSGTNVVYKLPHPEKANEYYLIENRQKTGRDAGLPDAGLAIWHCDTQGSNDYHEQLPNKHFEVTLVQADGRWDLENDRNYGDSTDLWKAPLHTLCGPESDPNTSWWDGSPSYLRLSAIGASASTMPFRFRGIGGKEVDTDGDGISDYDETRDLDSATPGIQNPFDPEDPDVVGNNGLIGPDGIPDGDNDWDGDGLSNADEFRFDTNPFDAASGLPAAAGLLLALAVLAIANYARLRGVVSSYQSKS
ncbi:MAG TPA: M6 family metalloprotease domain-containing protein [Candidatus Hydrogenedentes bacterium]|nr:M6 family metalloprotease domain-containing protein [Candidatus Hydrogenedentota bacterium]HRT20300.1 M6 family metalloprotease domain-containing protein [Candidatus Hydrogenedentota bacterium]HRT65025.1 M6 family metalloprotease domain-containing protein [Candidatus Hydrogenedentota bacterium]